MDELRNCESGFPPRFFFFFNFMARMNVEGGRGWLVLFTLLYRLFFRLCSNEFFSSKKKKKLYLCSYFYELWILNNYCVFEFINKFRLIEHKWDFLSFLTIISSLTRKTVRKDVWLLYIIFSNICFNYSNIRGEEWIK